MGLRLLTLLALVTVVIGQQEMITDLEQEIQRSFPTHHLGLLADGPTELEVLSHRSLGDAKLPRNNIVVVDMYKDLPADTLMDRLEYLQEQRNRRGEPIAKTAPVKPKSAMVVSSDSPNDVDDPFAKPFTTVTPADLDDIADKSTLSTEDAEKVLRMFHPQKYVLVLAVDPGKLAFHGAVQINGQVDSAASRRIVLNAAKNLKIVSSAVLQGSRVIDVTVSRIEESDHLILDLEEDAVSGDISVIVEYHSIMSLNSEMHGLYASSYTDASGIERRIISSQFEPTDARRTFPCVDHPADKAVFSVTLLVPNIPPANHFVVLSNMPELEPSKVPKVLGSSYLQTVINGIAQTFHSSKPRVVTFADTPQMSTYILAVVVGFLEHIKESFTLKSGGDPILVRCFGEIGKGAHLKFALKASIESLKFFSNFFGTPYALPKMDMVAIPNFASGAMENWGLVTYRYEAIYIQPASNSWSEKIRVASVVWHENAHQWFGNLVTLADWNELFLNEGFASLMETYSSEWLLGSKYPTWQMFATTTMEEAKEADSLASTSAVGKSVGASGEVSHEIFDAVSYDKGASVLRMLRMYLRGLRSDPHDDPFQKGVVRYIKKFSYANAKSGDLWESVTEDLGKSGEHVIAMVKDWLSHEGFPLVQATVDDTQCILRLSQQRFMFNAKESKQTSDPKWNIPIFLKYSSTKYGDATRLYRMEDKTMEIGCEDIVTTRIGDKTPCCFSSSEADWFMKLNWRQSGLFRVSYDEKLMSRLMTNFRSLPVVDRAGFIQDLFALNRFGSEIMPISAVLDTIRSIAKVDESSLPVWEAALEGLNWIQNVIRSEPTFANFQTFVLKMAHSAISKFGVNFVPDEDVTRHLLRAMWISTAVAFDSPDIQRKLAGKFVVSRRQGAPLDSYLRSAVLESAVKLNVPTRLPTSGADSPGPGSDEYGMPPSESAVQWMLLRSLRKQAFEHPQCLRAAAATRDSAQVDYILNFAIEKLGSADLSTIVGGLLKNLDTQERTFDFMKKNFPKLKEHVGGEITSLFRSLTSINDAAAVEEFMEKFGDSSVTKTKKRVLERIRLRHSWIKDNAEDLAKFFSGEGHQLGEIR